MGRTIREFKDGSILEYDRGSFDEWCVYLKRPENTRKPPKDIEYFRQIKTLAERFTNQKVYDDFVLIYEKTTKKIEENTLDFIHHVSGYYRSEQLDVDILFTIIYAGMVAEENKLYSKLGKRVKRLGIHQVLMEEFNPVDAANWSKGRPWRELAIECEKRGF